MDFTILPLKGAGTIRFGMTAKEVRSEIGLPFKSFKRTPQAAFPSDYFSDLGTFFYYNSDGRLDAVEFTSPATPTLDGIQLLDMNFETAKKTLLGRDSQIEQTTDGLFAYQIGVSVCAPLAKDDPQAPVESILIFRQGYFN